MCIKSAFLFSRWLYLPFFFLGCLSNIYICSSGMSLYSNICFSLSGICLLKICFSLSGLIVYRFFIFLTLLEATFLPVGCPLLCICPDLRKNTNFLFFFCLNWSTFLLYQVCFFPYIHVVYVCVRACVLMYVCMRAGVYLCVHAYMFVSIPWFFWFSCTLDSYLYLCISLWVKTLEVLEVMEPNSL